MTRESKYTKQWNRSYAITEVLLPCLLVASVLGWLLAIVNFWLGVSVWLIIAVGVPSEVKRRQLQLDRYTETFVEDKTNFAWRCLIDHYRDSRVEMSRVIAVSHGKGRVLDEEFEMIVEGSKTELRIQIVDLDPDRVICAWDQIENTRYQLREASSPRQIRFNLKKFPEYELLIPWSEQLSGLLERRSTTKMHHS